MGLPSMRLVKLAIEFSHEGIGFFVFVLVCLVKTALQLFCRTRLLRKRQNVPPGMFPLEKGSGEQGVPS
jgi:hypothetical protein